MWWSENITMFASEIQWSRRIKLVFHEMETLVWTEVNVLRYRCNTIAEAHDGAGADSGNQSAGDGGLGHEVTDLQRLQTGWWPIWIIRGVSGTHTQRHRGLGVFVNIAVHDDEDGGRRGGELKSDTSRRLVNFLVARKWKWPYKAAISWSHSNCSTVSMYWPKQKHKQRS